MSIIEIADDRALPTAAPGTSIRTALVSRRDEILSLRQNASEILYRLRIIRETWSETDLPPAQERWVLQQVIECLSVSCDPPSGDEFDRIAVAGRTLAVLVEMRGDDFAADAPDGDGYDLVDFDADLDDAEDLANGDAA